MPLPPSLRWHVKKVARSSVVLGSRVASMRKTDATEIRVLTYHGFGDAPRNPFFVHREVFAAQMAYVAEHALAISLKDLEAFLGRGQGVPRGAVLITIDDGLRSLHRDALPILRDLSIPAVAFITPGLLEGNLEPLVHPPEPYLTWREAAEVQSAGIEIGSHGWSHRSLGELPAVEAEDEAHRSRELLEQRLGTRVRALAYPYGSWPDFTPATRKALMATGYRYAFTSQHGAVRPGSDPLELPRIKVEGGDSMALFRRLPLGGMDPWRVVDRTLWRLQARP